MQQQLMKGGHEFEERGGVYMGGSTGRKWKGELQLKYNIKNKKVIEYYLLSWRINKLDVRILIRM